MSLPEVPRSTPTEPGTSGEQILVFAREAASALIDFIERKPASERPVCLERFPAGSCGDYSLLLHTYLTRHKIPSVYVRATGKPNSAKDWFSHCWVESGGHVIDGTMRQFADSFPRLHVGKATAWHRALRVESRGTQTVYEEQGPAIPELIEFYECFAQQSHGSPFSRSPSSA